MKKLAIIAFAAVAGGASALDLFDNGAVIEGFDQGTPVSIQNPPASFFGVSLKTGGGVNPDFQLADNFTVTGPGWRLTSVSFYAFQTGATNFTFNRAKFSAVTGTDPNAGATVLSVDTDIPGQGTVTNGGLVAYRVAETQMGLRNRPIFKVTVTGLNTILLPGAHMLRWSLDGTGASGPFAPPVEPFTYLDGNGYTAESSGVFNRFYDVGFIEEPGDLGRPVEFPFTLHGEVVPEPATMIALGAGIAAIAARRRRK